MAQFWKLKGLYGPEFLDPTKITSAYWNEDGSFHVVTSENAGLEIDDKMDRAWILGWLEQRSTELPDPDWDTWAPHVEVKEKA